MNLDRARRIVGWMSEPELQFLAESASKSSMIFEAGSYQGKSTRAMADNTDGIIHAVDPWKPVLLTQHALHGHVGVDNMTFTRFLINMNGHIESGKVIPHGMRWVNFTPPLNPDFIFIDALHDYENVKADINHALKLMGKGLLAGHDYNPTQWPGVIQAVDEIFGKDKVKLTDTIWSIEI